MDVIGGHIRIDSLAGSGGFGDVYRGYDIRMERPVAVKVIKGACGNEIAVFRRLDHAGLPRLYDVYSEDLETYLIMEWIDGVTLDKYIDETGPIDEALAVRIGEELLDILGFLHNGKPSIVYQDLKPANIMITPDMHVKLVDFGTAFFMKYGDEEIVTAGTVGFGAPEQRGLCRKRHASIRSDIYSWGAVMYSMLTGIKLNKPPYTMEKLRRVCPQASFGIERVISKATRRDEAERYVSTDEVKRAIKRGAVTDSMYRMIFIMLVIASVSPFIYVWYKCFSNDYFAVYKSAAINAWRMMLIKKLYKPSTRVLRGLGEFLASGAWMFLGLRLIQKKKYLRINKSIYLSEKKHPGLWVGTAVSGLILGLFIGCEQTIISYASQEPLPVSVCDEYGNHCLVAYDSIYAPEGELRLCIGRNILDKAGDCEVTVILSNPDTGMVKRRTIELMSPVSGASEDN